MKRIKKLVVFAVIFVNLFTMTAFAEGNISPKDAIDYLDLIKQFIMNYYMGEVTDEAILEGALKNVIRKNPELLEQALKGMFEPLDQYSVYFTDEEYEQFTQQVDGQYGGIGITVQNREGHIVIMSVLENSPALRAGLKAGDKIVSVDDVDVSDYDVDMVLPLLRGEAGTSVKIGVIREGYEGILTFNVVRDVIKINPITFKILDGNVGYIKISDFNINTAEFTKKAIDTFDKNNVKKVIIDLRYNPGGALQQVVEVAKYFVPNRGAIVHIEFKDGTRKTYKSTLTKAKYKIAVLINGSSASASEILAGAIQDSKAGIIVGEKSFGKGSVQDVIPLGIGGAIKMTTARYLTPSGRSIDGIGIYPDVEVSNTWQRIDMSTLEEMPYKRKPSLGDKGKDVLAAEQRLQLLGYDVGTPDEVFDEKTQKAIMDFQKSRNLYPYGVLDINTQIELNNAVWDLEIEVDRQLEKAIELLNQ
ncbi:MAG: S41 family peptidase [Clostridiaceae bacterium]|nr:S41 family peptidase [Clostridiaceae bacterium]